MENQIPLSGLFASTITKQSQTKQSRSLVLFLRGVALKQEILMHRHSDNLTNGCLTSTQNSSVATTAW